ncbi:MAG: hypothetical protein ABL896_05575 [Hylemonella sp.]
MNSLRAHWLALAVCSAAAGPAVAQNIYTELGLPGLYSLSGSLSLRGDSTPGLNWNRSGSEGLVDTGAGLQANRARVYADWFPFGGGLRLVGGVNLTENRPDLVNAPVNGLAGSQNSLRLKYPNSSTYLGIGYGQHTPSSKGLGFYADMGVSLSTLPADADTSQGGGTSSAAGMEGWRTQTNGWLSFRYLPSVSLGLIYRY